MTFLLLELILADQLADLPPTPSSGILVVKNGNVTFLLLELILADQVASTVRAHNGRSTDRSTPQ